MGQGSVSDSFERFDRKKKKPGKTKDVRKKKDKPWKRKK